MRKRFLAMLLCLCMVVALLPTVALAEEAPAETITNSEMLSPNTDPGEDWENDASNPYGTNKDQPFSLNPVNELVLYTNKKTDEVFGRGSGGRIYINDFDVDKSQASIFDGTNYTVGDSIVYGEVSYLEDKPNAGYVSGIAFDPYGTGRADHAAYVGFVTHEINGVTKTMATYWVQDLKTGYCTPILDIQAAPDWKEIFYQYQAKNFFNITAGDYNGDGKETVAITVPNNDDIIVLETPEKNNFTQEQPIPTYISTDKFSDNLSANTTNITSQLSISLASGDFDRDGIDELAVSAGMCYITDQEFSAGADMTKYDSWLTVLDGDGSNSFTPSNQVNKRGLMSHDSSRDQTQGADNFQYFNMIRFPSIAAGDVNGDGYDDVVIAGYLGELKHRSWTIGGSMGDSYTAKGAIQEKIAYATYYGGSNTITDVNTMDMNTYTAHGTPAGMEVRPALAVTCASIDGYGTAEYVFIAGTVYKLNTNGAATEVMKTNRAHGTGSRQGNLWYDSAVAGNFDGNAAGREQIVAVAFEKVQLKENYDCYVDTIGGYEYDDVIDGDKVLSYGAAKQLYSNYASMGMVITNVSSSVAGSRDINLGERMSCLVLASDVDDDGVMVQYKTKGYGYSDAKVQAVLQAAPYFGELGDYDEDFSDGSTSYSISSGYTDTTSSSNSVSFGAAFVTEHSFGVWKFDVHAGITVDWTETYEQSLSVEYSSEFSAGGDDTVVVYRIPATTYYYAVYDPDTKQFEYDENNAMAVVIPETPVYTTMDKQSYNEFATQYNERYKDSIEGSLAKALPLITEEVLPDATGDPFAYWSNYGKVEIPGVETAGDVSGFVSLSDSPKQLGTGSSSITNGWTKSEEFSNGTETSVGFAVSTTHQWGVPDHTAGFEASFGYNHAWGKIYTTMESMGASGTVNSLDRRALEKNYGIPSDITQQYNFTWDFGMRTWTPGNDNSVPVFGYVLTSLRAGSPRPSNLEAAIQDLDTVELNWTVPESSENRLYDGLNLWRSKDGGSYEKINTDPLGVDETAYLVSDLDSNTQYSFVVSSTYEGNDGAFSVAATVTMPKRNYQLNYSGSNVDISASYLGDISIADGASVAEESIVFVTAVPETGYTITGITLITPAGKENVTLVGNKFNFILRDDTTIQVDTECVVDYSELTLDQPEYGGSFTASVVGEALSGGVAIVVGPDPVELEATPEGGYVLKAWIVDRNQIQALGNNAMTFTPYLENHIISALFVEEDDPSVNVDLTVNTSNGGTLEITDASGAVLTPDDSGLLTLRLGTEITVTAQPNNHYSLKNWTGALSNYRKETQSVTLSVTEEMTVGAEFYAPIQYPVSFSAGENGTLSAEMDGEEISGAKTNVVPGSSIAFTARADSGYRISGWTVTGFGESTVSYADRLVTSDTLNLTDITSSSKVRVNFTAIDTCTLTFDPGAGTGEPYTVQTDELTKYTLPANTFTAPASMVFNSWQIGQRSYSAGDKCVFYGDTTITALWRSSNNGGGGSGGGGGGGGGGDTSYSDYTITATAGTGGSISPSGSVSVRKGLDKTFNITPNDGYVLSDVLVDGVSVKNQITGNSYTFVNVQNAHTIRATFIEESKINPDTDVENPFTDAKESDWFFEDVMFVYTNKLMFGTSDTIFSPSDTTTRAMAATILWRMEGSPEVTSSSFTDVPEGKYYTDAITWAKQNDIVKGYSDTLFGPDDFVTREQLAAFFYRYAQYKGYDTTISGSINSFNDKDKVSDWAADAMKWAVGYGVIQGNTGNLLDPQGDATRAQLAAMLHRIIDKNESVEA